MKTKPLARLRSRICTSAALAIAGLTISLTCVAQTTTEISVDNGDFAHAGGATQLRSPNLPNSPNQNLLGWTVNDGLVWWYGTTTELGMSGATSPSTVPNPWVLWNRTGTSSSNTSGGTPNGLTTCNVMGCGGGLVALDGGSTAITSGEGTIEGRISQALRGLTPGETTNVSFFFAAGQGHTFSGATESLFQVSLCPGGNAASPVTDCAGGVERTDVRMVPSHGFAPWEKETLTFKPTSANDVLSFLAVGTPGNLPPVALLDGLHVTQTSAPPPPTVIPEPGTLGLLGTGLIGLAGMARRKFKLWT